MIDPTTLMFLLFVALLCGAVAAFLVPVYLGIWAGLHWVYTVREKPNPMPTMKYEVSAVLDRFQLHCDYWYHHSAELSLTGFALPLLLPVLIGVLAGGVLAFLVARYAMNIFRVTD